MTYSIVGILAALMWTRYVVSYLVNRDFFGKFLLNAGRVFFALQVAAVTTNLFMPVMFWFDDKGIYHAGSAACRRASTRTVKTG